jgi:hypothetical protein
MISCLLIHVSRDAQGSPVRKESTITGEPLQIGRNVSCRIHLPDHRVELLHAAIKQSENGTLWIEAESDAIVSINGFIEEGAALSPGTRIEIGPYLLLVEPAPEGHDIVLSVELIHPQPQPGEAGAHRPGPVTLAELGLNKRRLGCGLAAAILFLFLFLPPLPSLSPALDEWQAALPVSLTDAWNPGTLSDGHGVFGARCSTCHDRPFREVADKTCAGCHKQVTLHVAKEDAGVFDNLRCSNCHPDHRGRDGLVLHDSPGCVACHGNLKARKATTPYDDARDFGADHPPFRISLRSGEQVVRAAKIIEKPGLRFSHQVHLAKEGVSTPEGTTVMACRDCHVLEDSGLHFAPMTMAKTCQQSQCHQAYFPKPLRGVVPHVPERELMSELRDFYAKWLAGAPANLDGCDGKIKAGDAAGRILRCAGALAHESGAALFAEKGDALFCGECHDIAPSGSEDAPWKVAPLRINRDWLPGAVFVHARHDTMDCVDCHDKANSKTSADVAMPPIEKCRECHVGDQTARGKIRSACDSCHRFHPVAAAAGG